MSFPALTPMSGDSIVQQIINKITDAIISGELKPGDKLPTELELIEQLNVSRNTLRSSIQTLRAYGVLEVHRPEGTFVCKNFTPKILNPMLYSIIMQGGDSSKDLIGLRRIVDIGIYSLIASQGITADEESNLESLYAEMLLALHDENTTPEIFGHIDLKFHDAIAQTSHNSFAIMINNFLLNLASESIGRAVKTIFAENNREYLAQAHRKILDVIEGKPNADMNEALDFSYIYWKKVCNL